MYSLNCGCSFLYIEYLAKDIHVYAEIKNNYNQDSFFI